VNEAHSLTESFPLKVTRFLLNKNTLVPVVVLLALMILLSAHSAFAQAQAPPAYTPPTSLNSFPPPSVPNWLDTGSNAWMMTAGTLVGLMSIPGIALYYGGLTRKKFSINTAMMCFYGFAAVLVVWVLLGYNFGFGPAGLKIGT
jgi:ammonium transporter, Amt family